MEANDLEKVAMTRSTPSSIPKCWAVPPPCSPSTPTEWASSTITRAPNSSASATIAGSGAMSPSMEKMPSVTTSIPLPALASSRRRSASMSACG
jgi:hypothetical protein